MAYWLVKSEADVYPIDKLRDDGVTPWDGVRNYQARNFLREMKIGDQVLYYHSNADEIGIVGLAKVTKLAFPDPTQFDKRSSYYDDAASKEEPRWFCPEISFVRKFSRILSLDELKKSAVLKGMLLLRKGNRLSVLPVTEKEFEYIVKAAD